MRRLFSVLFVVTLAGCSEKSIDESVVAGTWAVAGDRCSGSGEKLLTYKEGNFIGNNFGVREPFFRILSAKRQDREVWIEFQPVLARRKADPMGVVFIDTGGKLVGQRTFDGKDFSASKDIVNTLTWTRCRGTSA